MPKLNNNFLKGKMNLDLDDKIIPKGEYRETGNRKFLIQKDLSFLTEYNKNSNTTGVPKYYGNWDNDTVYVAPTPSSGFTVELALNRMPSSLTSAGSSGTTWLSTNGEDVLLYGCLVEAYKFLKGPAS